MARKKQGSFKMKGHTLPGINQRSETANIKDGRAPSSAFQMAEPGSSPHKGFGKFLGKVGNVMTGGLGGAIGKGLKGDWKGALGSLATGGMSSFLPGGGAGRRGGAGAAGAAGAAMGMGGGGGDDAAAGAELLKKEAKEAMQG